MERRIVKTLIVNDTDLDCDCEKTTLDNMTILNLGFISKDIEDYELIIYKGKRGTKILRSKFCNAGKIIDDLK